MTLMTSLETKLMIMEEMTEMSAVIDAPNSTTNVGMNGMHYAQVVPSSIYQSLTPRPLNTITILGTRT